MVSQEVQTIPVIQVSLVLEESFGKMRKQIAIAKMMGWIANDLKSFDNIAGIQVVNEAEFSDPAKNSQLTTVPVSPK